MKTEFYLTLKDKGEGIYKAKGSKFLGFAYPVGSEEEIRERIAGLKKQFHDARHHCFAWRLGSTGDHFRAVDDGEPSNSAGQPILGQIRARDLTGVLVVVVRYFGGTLLGVGGLIQAYRAAASEALDNATVTRKYIYEVYRIRFEYAAMNTVMKILKELDAEQSDQDFGLRCSLKARVKSSAGEQFRAAFSPFPEITVDYLCDE